MSASLAAASQSSSSDEEALSSSEEEELDKDVPWKDHPARALLRKAFMNGDIPLDYGRQPKTIYDKYKSTHAFAGMLYDEAFTRRLRAIRDQAKKKGQRVVDDARAFEVFRKNFPVKPHNHKGELRWEGSAAQGLLKEDLAMGRHLEFGRVKLFWLSRQEYQLFKQSIFRGHVDQEKRHIKLQNFLTNKESKKHKNDDEDETST